MAEFHYRVAEKADVAALCELEEQCFATDRLSRRSFVRFTGTDRAHLLVAVSAAPASAGGTNLDGATSGGATSGGASSGVATPGGDLLGYSLILFHRGTSLARLYSIAILPTARGAGIAEQLLERGEAAAVARGRVFMRLEVHTKNPRAIRLYEKHGYRRFGVYHDYYADHSDALRMQKRIVVYPIDESHSSLPYYPQTTDFTCGPACLMMAMATLDSDYQPSRSDEFKLWREATTIYMTSGHGGCGPHGLALAAARRGFKASAFISQRGPLFVEGVRRVEKKSVLTQVHQDFLDDLAQTDVTLTHRGIDIKTLRRAIALGGVPLVLISTYRFDRRKSPHWVLVAAIDARFVYIHDPDIDAQTDRDRLDNQYLPIEIDTFLRSTQFGQQRLRAALIINRRESA